jgi:hypothetical protein
MSHEVRHTRQPDITGELTIGLAEDGTLQFEDGVATVADEARAAAIADRYTGIEYLESDADADRDDDSDDEAEAEGFDAASFVDRTPMDDVVEDLESGDYDDHLDAIAAAEADKRDREGVADAVDARRE